MLIALTLGLSLGARSANIVWKPQVGDIHRYKWSAWSEDFPGPDGVTTLSQEEIDADTIKEVRPNGDIVEEVKVTGIKAKLGSSDVASKASSEVRTQTLVYNPSGLLLDWSSDAKGDVDNPRMDRVERLIYPDHPVNAGDTWTYKESANPTKGIYDNEAVFTFRGSQQMNGVLAKKITFAYKETGILLSISASGTFWVSPDDGSIVKKDIQVNNLNVPPNNRQMNLHITVTRIEDAATKGG